MPRQKLNLIERYEEECTKRLCETNLIPKCGTWGILEKWGITKQESANSLFYEAKLPVGWTRTLDSDNHRIIHILDENKNRKVTIFYKAATYDEKADFIIHSCP